MQLIFAAAKDGWLGGGLEEEAVCSHMCAAAATLCSHRFVPLFTPYFAFVHTVLCLCSHRIVPPDVHSLHWDGHFSLSTGISELRLLKTLQTFLSPPPRRSSSPPLLPAPPTNQLSIHRIPNTCKITSSVTLSITNNAYVRAKRVRSSGEATRE